MDTTNITSTAIQERKMDFDNNIRKSVFLRATSLDGDTICKELNALNISHSIYIVPTRITKRNFIIELTGILGTEIHSLIILKYAKYDTVLPVLCYPLQVDPNILESVGFFNHFYGILLAKFLYSSNFKELDT